MAELADWSARERPKRQAMEGRFARLEPLSPEAHGDALFDASRVSDAAERFAWLPDLPPVDRADYDGWLARSAASADPQFFAVIDRRTGRAEGRQALMRIDVANGVAEIGNIYWGPAIARSPVTTEAFYLFARHLFDDLGYRRFEWKCNALNGPSRRAAERFGMVYEGRFRQHMVVKGHNRDTAWFSMIDGEWPEARAAFETWLSPKNFRADGTQIRALASLRGNHDAERGA